jgi:hypothetical protein
MIPKLWLAALLGLILGVGIAYSTEVPFASQASLPPTAQPFEVARQVGQTQARSHVSQPAGQLALISLIAGILIAAPILLVSRRGR